VDAKLALSAVDIGIAIARFLWHKAHGADATPDEDAIKAAGAKALEGAALAAAIELDRRAREAGVTAAANALTKATSELLYELGRVETDPSPDVPNILAGADVQEMPADWKPEQSIDDWDNVKTPTPDGSSER
jgi:hypothetical protein